MNISLNFIKKYVEIPENISPEQIAYDITMRTVEVEKVINASEKFHDIVAGEIKEVKSHPNADSLRICMVDVGEEEIKQIVCGGSNLVEGHKVCVSKPGAEVVWHGEGEPVLIKESKLRGEPSYGMICGADEVYLGDYFHSDDERKIVDFDELGIKAEVGQNISELIDMNDTIFEVDNKSLSNRPDLWGHYGIAREIAAIYKLPLKRLSSDIPQGLPVYDVKIESPKECPRYTATKIENVYVKESPNWMKSILLNAGMRPINAIVDITNYVMLAVGQPLHAFDSSHVEDEQIIVRTAVDGEKLLLLDDLDLNLMQGDLVICDSTEPMALAGIKGGKKDSILSDTKDILLEAATFTASGIRKTSKRFDEKTDASMRYEKGVDTQRVDLGLSMAIDLFKEIYPDCKIVSFGESYPYPTQRAEVNVSEEFLNTRLGQKVDNDEIIDILTRIGFDVEFFDGIYHCNAPTWRSTGDISIKDDVMGEIARLIGYEMFEKKPLPVHFDNSVNQIKQDMARRMKEYLAFRCGFFEIFTYPWVDEKYIRAAKSDNNKIIKLATPPSPEQASLRISLIPGMLEAIDKNSRYYDDFNIFETAQTFEKGEYSPTSSDEKLPVHKNLLTGVMAGKDATKLFFTLKGVLESLPEYCHCGSLKFKQESKPEWADDKVWLNIYSDTDIIGSLALISMSALNDAGVKLIKAAAFEINTDLLKPFPSRTNEFKHMPQFPLVEQDLSIIVDESVKWDEIAESIKYMVKELNFIEEYRGQQIPEGKKSIMLRLKIGNDDSTMTSKQIDKKMNGILKVLSNKCCAELR